MPSIEKFLTDYTPSVYGFESCDMIFDIQDGYTLVTNTLQIQKNTLEDIPLFLHGKGLELIQVSVNTLPLQINQYQFDEAGVKFFDVKHGDQLTITTKIYPEKNTELEGLYFSDGMYCTQNEPEGFRKITYFLDRPDVMTVFTTTIQANKKYPILLSNGNLIDQGNIGNDRHFTKWHDPFKKPSYLFALVAADLGKISDTFTTMSGRKVDLHIFSEHGNQKKCLHAMESLKKAMRWDEETYGREYDLDVFHIVATNSFNMGAMENKSLNIFNTIYVLADLETATDKDFLGVESVIGHEYFHNWTGNRITCRDWFQLTLKEGLTVFRDHDFSGDMNSRSTMRIEDIRDLREYQFGEDAGPTAHPIQPASYKEMNNFYTATVYEKGSEVIRMMAMLLGKETFRKAMDLYFDTFDGQAVCTQDFVWAMSTAGKRDLTQFEATWYHQERTPALEVETNWDSDRSTYIVTLRQKIDTNTRGEKQKPFFYPLAIGLFDGETGVELPLKLRHTSTLQDRIQDGILIISQDEEIFEFEAVTSKSILSINRGFSAPIQVSYRDNNPLFLMRYETDGFARYESAQLMAIQVIQDIMSGKEISQEYLDIYGDLLVIVDDNLYQSLMIQIPSINAIISSIGGPIDIDRIESSRKQLIETLVSMHYTTLQNLYKTLWNLLPEVETTDAREMGIRAYIGSILGLLRYSHDEDALIRQVEGQYEQTQTMTLNLSALAVLMELSPEHPMIQRYIDKYGTDPLVIMKYFSLVGSMDGKNVIEQIQNTQKASFYNPTLPNHAKALFGSFSRNLPQFHRNDGSGYALITDFILQIDPINPHTAARMAGAFKLFPKLIPELQDVMRPFLEKILQTPDISKNTGEIVEKILHYKQ